METILPIISDICIIFFDLTLFTRMVSLRKDTALNKAIMYIGCAVIIAVYFVVTYIIMLPASMSSFLCMSLPSLLLFFLLSKHRDSRFFLTFCFVDTISLIIAFLARYAGILLGNFGSYVSLLITIVLFSALLFFGRHHFKRYAELLEVTQVGWGSMAIATALIYLALIFFAAYPSPLVGRVEYGPVYLLFSAVIVACYVVFLQSIFKTQKIHEQNKQLQREKEIYRIAYTDALTGLYNRASFIEKINQLERASEIYSSICCMVLDINDFKKVNDTSGHYVGDTTLIRFASTLQQVFEDHASCVFRMGGDEFYIILCDVSRDEVEERCTLLAKDWENRSADLEVRVSVAVGYDFYHKQAGDSIEKTFIRADKNMYADKADKKIYETGTVIS